MITSLRMLAIPLCCILSMFGAEAIAQETGGLGLSRDDVIALATASGALAREDFKVVTFASGESVLVGGHSRFTITAFGAADSIHTLRFDLLGENARREDPAALDRIAGDVMAHVFPDWPDASSWPRNSLDEANARLRAALQEFATRRKEGRPTQELDLFAFSREAQRDDKWLAALNWLMGYSYLITTHPDCLPTRGRRYWKSLGLEHFRCFE